jgi:hypothetical protein
MTTWGIGIGAWITISLLVGVGYAWIALHMRDRAIKLRQSEQEDWLEQLRRTGRM